MRQKRKPRRGDIECFKQNSRVSYRPSGASKRIHVTIRDSRPWLHGLAPPGAVITCIMLQWARVYEASGGKMVTFAIGEAGPESYVPRGERSTRRAAVHERG